MIRTKDHKTLNMFDSLDHLGPRRRQLLEQSWASVFRKEILPELPFGAGRPVLLGTKRGPDERTLRNVGSDACSTDLRPDRQGGSQTVRLQLRMASCPRHRRRFGPQRLRFGKDPVEHAPLADRE